jgi:rubrerythrin
MFDVPMPQVESTLENLNAALVEQKFEADNFYPTFLTAATPLFDATAARSFQSALEADRSHVRLYDDVVPRVNAAVKSGWAYEPHDFFVCTLCGYTAEVAEAENCPACNYPWEKFETVR